MDKCLESVMKQTLSDIEIILVENASTDKSLEKCHEYAAKDSRIKVIHLDVGDLALARNTGLKDATADYVAFLDSDD
jgi:glycosyltransferase involved in cell wall biosynthesis